MKKVTNKIFCLFAITLLGGVLALPMHADASSTKKSTHKKAFAVVTKWPQTCPVSGEPIASAKDAVGSEVYKGKTYYFCCSMCKPEFDKNPAKYAAAAAKGKYLMPM